MNFKWVQRNVAIDHLQGQRQKFPLEKGYADLNVWWGARVRREALVFARYGNGKWGSPSVVSFCQVPNEQRQYDKEGSILSIDYLQANDVMPCIYQNKAWRDVYSRNSLGDIIGFLRTCNGQIRDEFFSVEGERVWETYAGDLPKMTAKVRYFTRSDDPLTLDYEVTKERVNHPQKPFVPRNRGEFPVKRKK